MPTRTCGQSLLAAIGCILLGACGLEQEFEAQAFLYNRTDDVVFAEVAALSGDCNALWRSGEGFVRQEDFAAVPSQRHRIDPGQVAPLEGCSAAVSLGSLATALIWDPALPQRRIRVDEAPDDRSQFLELVASGKRRKFEFRSGVHKLDVLPAGSPAPQSECAAASVPSVGISLFNGEGDGEVQDLEEHAGCFTLHLPRRSAPQESLAAVHACVPAELFPFAKGDTLRVRDNLIERTLGDPARLALFSTEAAPRLPALPSANSSTTGLQSSWSLSECGLVRDRDGLAWQPLEMRFSATPLPAGVPVAIGSVTYYVARAAHPVLGGLNNTIIWLELHR